MIFTCLYCGKSADNGKNRAQRFCSPPPGVNMSDCASAHNRSRARLTPEQRAHRRAYQREYMAKQRQDPAAAEALRTYRREYRRKHPDKSRADRVRYEQRHPDRVRAKNAEYNLRRRPGSRSGPLAGSVLAASSHRAPGRDVLVALLALVPRGHDESHREEVVATAVLLHLEGASLEDAAREAARSVSRESSRLRHSRPLHECNWL